MATKEVKDDKVGIVGSGLIGSSWAGLFAAAGYKVTIYDIEPQQVETALKNIEIQLKTLEKQGLLRGSLSVQEQHQRITGTTSLKECVEGAMYVQECVPENLELKKAVFKQIDEFASDEAILASSCSTMPASTFTAGLKHQSRTIIAHPVNPPSLVPLVEIVPTPVTKPEVVTATLAIQEELGQSPVLLKKEVLGFGLNRLQYALMCEAYRLVQSGVMSPDDVDKLMRDGIGMRYAFIGPFETAQLNADGVENYCERYGNTMYDTSLDMGPVPKWEGETLAKIHKDMCEKVPLDKLKERREWRDRRLVGLAKLKMDLDKADGAGGSS